MLRWHRLCALVAFPVLLYILVTGAATEYADMRALVAHAPETGAEMRQMRAHVYGPPSYVVVSATDYDAPALPASLDLTAALQRTAALARTAVPGGELRLVELRTYLGQPVGHARMGTQDLAFDLASGATLPAAALPWPQPTGDLASLRSSFKDLHRLAAFGMLSAGINLVAGIALSVMLVTGLLYYRRLWQARARIGRGSVFWRGPGLLRTLHRALSLVAVVPVLWLLLSGLALSLDNFIPALQMGAARPPPMDPATDPFSADLGHAMTDDELPGMAQQTLLAFTTQFPGTGIKVLRLRHFVDYPQGVVVAADADTTQRVFDTRNGRLLSMAEPGYPHWFFPEGWEIHQALKRMHRGDLFGMPGRWIASFAALSLLFLIGSGSYLYLQQWRRRRHSGRSELIWK